MLTPFYHCLALNSDRGNQSLYGRGEGTIMQSHVCMIVHSQCLLDQYTLLSPHQLHVHKHSTQQHNTVKRTIIVQGIISETLHPCKIDKSLCQCIYASSDSKTLTYHHSQLWLLEPPLPEYPADAYRERQKHQHDSARESARRMYRIHSKNKK